jgi:UDP-N-acetylmuramoyl-tripeptide--D-alanyl-D-alanine ligase
MKNLTLKNLAAACGGRCVGPEEKQNVCVTAITTDSRKVTEGCLFAAIRGARTDGHRFIGQVMEQGALGVLAEQEPEDRDIPCIVVDSTLQALKDIAEYYLKQLHIPVIGIAGSVGKTSTKEMVAAVLGQRFRVLKTEGNFNNELGLPLTVFRLSEEDEMAVLEMGISDFGEMHRLAKIARPDTCIMTNIGWCHLENLKDRDGILKAKSEIFDFLEPDGHIVLNGDDDKLAQIREVRGIRPLRFGLDPSGDVWADKLESLGLKGIRCRIHTPEASFAVSIPMPGRHMVYNALAGTAAGLLYGLTPEEIKKGIESFASLSGRFHILETPEYTIIDDCYNANPVSMKASLQVLQEGSGRRVAVLGDMGELGADEKKLHREVGAFAAGLSIDAIYCAGPLCQELAEGAEEAGADMEIRHFHSRDQLMVELKKLLKKGDTVLVKASHYMQFEKVVSLLQGEN